MTSKRHSTLQLAEDWRRWRTDPEVNRPRAILVEDFLDLFEQLEAMQFAVKRYIVEISRAPGNRDEEAVLDASEALAALIYGPAISPNDGGLTPIATQVEIRKQPPREPSPAGSPHSIDSQLTEEDFEIIAEDSSPATIMGDGSGEVLPPLVEGFSAPRTWNPSGGAGASTATSEDAAGAEDSSPAKSPFPPPPDLTVGAVDYLTQREDGSWESNQESKP